MSTGREKNRRLLSETINLPWELATNDEGIEQKIKGLLGGKFDEALSGRIINHIKKFGTSGRNTVAEIMKGLQREQIHVAEDSQGTGLTDRELQQKIGEVTQKWIDNKARTFFGS